MNKSSLLLPVTCRLFVSILAAVAVSCSTLPSESVAEWSAVAIVDGNNSAAQDKVRLTLQRSNIVCFMEGSLAYAVMVPKVQLEQAKRALLEDPELRRPWLIVLQDGEIPSIRK